MTIRYTNIANVLPETKLRMYPTKVINIIGGPGCGKSMFSAAIVLFLHLHGKTVETIPDHAKALVWQRNFEVLKNQYFIAQRQFEMLNLLDGQVQFLVTESSLPQTLYYNENYEPNICDVAKTRAQIINGVFRQRGTAIDKIGGIGRCGRVKRTDPDAKQAKWRAIGFVL